MIQKKTWITVFKFQNYVPIVFKLIVSQYIHYKTQQSIIIILQMQKKEKHKKVRKIGPYILIDKIGQGSNSIVFEGRSQQSGQKYAIKQVSLQNISDKKLERLHLEVNILKRLKHENIISLLDHKQTSHNLYLVFEYCEFTDLNSFIKKQHGGILPEEQVKEIMYKIKQAFKVIRQHKIVHRDLKLNNILVTHNFQIKLADFGFAKLLDQNQYFKSYVGTPLTMAPEIFTKKPYNEKCDIWSLGIIAYQMLFGKNPFFPNKDRLTEKQIISAFNKKVIQFPQMISDQAKDFILKSLVADPKQRMTFEQFFFHPWLRSTNPFQTQSEFFIQKISTDLQKTLTKGHKLYHEKEFISRNCQEILNYSIFEYIKNYIQNSVTIWINIAKRIMDMQNSNSQLCFLAINIILQNIKIILTNEFDLVINQKKRIKLPKYDQLRKQQTWQMTQFTKRLPNFLAKSIFNMEQFTNRYKKLNKFDLLQTQIDFLQLYLEKLQNHINNQDEQSFKIFLKLQSYSTQQMELRIESGLLSEETLSLLIERTILQIDYHQQFKKCQIMFKMILTLAKNNFNIKIEKLKFKMFEQQ